MRETEKATPRSGTVVLIDPRSREVLARADRSTRTAGDAFLLWQRIVHGDGVLGVPGRFVTFLGGLLRSVLMVTGVIMYLHKRRARLASKLMPSPPNGQRCAPDQRE